MVNRTYACVNIVNLYITLVDFVVHVNLCNTTGQISASFDIASGEICGLVVKLCLMHFCDSYLARNGHVANLPEKDSNAKIFKTHSLIY